jgi:DNA-binding response OmpR family regulator
MKPLVLLVDDEMSFLEEMEAALHAAGIDALVCATTRAALDTLDTWRDCIGLLIMDISLPGEVGSPALARRARECNPAIKVIYIAADRVPEDERSDVPGRLLSKPFSPDLLVREVTTLLGKAQNQAAG